MDHFADPTGKGRTASLAVGMHMALSALFIVLSLIAPDAVAPTGVGMALAFVGVARFLVLLVAAALVAIWVYRVNSNAQGFVDGLSITPGWNVGWFFVPVGNLWKPFEGIRETWQASEDPGNWSAVSVPIRLRIWWGCWIVGGMAGNLALRVDGLGRRELAASPLQFVEAGLLMVGGALFIRIIGQLSAMQRRTHAAMVFA